MTVLNIRLALKINLPLQFSNTNYPYMFVKHNSSYLNTRIKSHKTVALN